MAFTVLAHRIDGSASGSGFTTTGIDTSGADLIVGAVAWFGSTADFSDLVGGNSNTWTPLTPIGGGGGTGIQLFYCHNPTVGSGHTFTTTSAFAAIAVIAVSGSAASPFDQESGASGVSQPGSITPSFDNEILITALVNSDAGTQTVDSGFTIEDQIGNNAAGNNVAAALAYIIETSLAAKNPSWSPASNGKVVMAAFKASAVAGSSAPVSLLHSRAVPRSNNY